MALLLNEMTIKRCIDVLQVQIDAQEEELRQWLHAYYDIYASALESESFWYREDELIHCLVQLKSPIDSIIEKSIIEGAIIKATVIQALAKQSVLQTSETLYETLAMVFEGDGYLSNRHSFDGIESEFIEAVAKKMMTIHPEIQDFYDGALLYTYELLEELPLRDINSCSSSESSSCVGCHASHPNSELLACETGCHCPKKNLREV